MKSAAGKRVRQDNGRLAAIKAATMTKEEWKEWQTEKMAKKFPKPAYMLEKKPLVHVRDGGEGAYRDETYAFVTRWTAKTRIQYRPHAKAPGSKSHVRYEKYAKATTVGQAYEFETYPMDWCFDYEHGFIKVLGGPMRDEPLDLSQVDDLSKLTEVDKVIAQWHKRELAKKYGLNLADLATDKGGMESVLVRAHRLVADREAARYLAQAEKEGRPVNEEEVEKTLTFWGFQKNAARVNVFPDGKDWVWSDNLGLTRDRRGDIHLTYATKAYPNLIKLLVQWFTARLPAEASFFGFTSLNLNCNYAAKRHRDGNNLGPSAIKAFGDFTGGELSVFPNDDKSRQLENLPEDDRVACDIKKNLCLFNGNSAHQVADFEGRRFSIVYFTASCYAKTKPEDIKQLRELGFRFPHDVDPLGILSAPAGFKGPGASPRPRGAVPKQLRLWPVADLDARFGKKRPRSVDQSSAERPAKKAALLKRPASKRG